MREIMRDATAEEKAQTKIIHDALLDALQRARPLSLDVVMGSLSHIIAMLFAVYDLPEEQALRQLVENVRAYLPEMRVDAKESHAGGSGPAASLRNVN